MKTIDLKDQWLAVENAPQINKFDSVNIEEAIHKSHCDTIELNAKRFTCD